MSYSASVKVYRAKARLKSEFLTAGNKRMQCSSQRQSWP